MYNPASTYRIQFHKEFTFKQFKEIIPYLKHLGIKTVYASPVFCAVQGSNHGYDVTDPLRINPEIGTEDELLDISAELSRHGIGWLQDIVPNHMAFHPSNHWLMDVLRKWEKSEFFNYFDLNFPQPMDDKRLMVPFLGESLADAITTDKLQLVHSGNGYYLQYGEDIWPLNAESEAWIRQSSAEDALRVINADKQMLASICDRQYYRLCHWQETDRHINYRRFFTVNGLICLNMQDQEVFETYHSYIVDLVKRGIFQGLRVDHVDGLADPYGYLKRLRDAAGPEVYIVVEKILGREESLPSSWPIQGSSGYDYLAMVNNLLTNKVAANSFKSTYFSFIGKQLEVSDLMLRKKRDILQHHMQGELSHLVSLFRELGLDGEQHSPALDISELKELISYLLVRMPVYRFYVQWDGSKEDIVADILHLMQSYKHINPPTERLRELLSANTANSSLLTFLQRCMQYSGPLMAKGIEDTLMYTYNAFIGHGDVGDAPEAFGISIAEFHELMRQRFLLSPYTMNTTSTHDTKRGEDVRARLNVLSDLPVIWAGQVNALAKLYRDSPKLKLHINDAYFIFQTVIGALPYRQDDKCSFRDRVHRYIEKALREAKKRSGWARPDQEYEQAAKRFVDLLIPQHNGSDNPVTTILNKIKDYAIVNSLIQLSVKCLSPGIPDIYQGTELWDLSLVDPDNRRPVDYQHRWDTLQKSDNIEDITELWDSRTTGAIKLWLTNRLLRLRQNYTQLFAYGDYQPLNVEGPHSDRVVAFQRSYNTQTVFLIAVLGTAALANSDGVETDAIDVSTVCAIIPALHDAKGLELLTGQSFTFDQKGKLSAGGYFKKIPMMIGVINR